ncbi:MAG: cupin [Actinomycetales bacterium]|nr:MAG: cupin [Actinomycetales bacterium]
MTDFGPKPYVVNIEKETVENTNYRTTLWTGENLQLTVMSIEPGDDIGLEVHDDHDQFLRLEAGKALVQMGPTEDELTFEETATDDWAVFVPAGTWHNLTNVGDEALKVYSIYAPPEHAHGTVHVTKSDDDHHH